MRLLLLVLLATACSSRSSRSELDGSTLYELHGCATCHGAGGEGRSLGPPLRGLDAHWEREALADFLLDPAAASAGSERLAELAETYPNQMQAYRNTTAEERLRIADFLLSLP